MDSVEEGENNDNNNKKVDLFLSSAGSRFFRGESGKKKIAINFLRPVNWQTNPVLTLFQGSASPRRPQTVNTAIHRRNGSDLIGFQFYRASLFCQGALLVTRVRDGNAIFERY